MEKRSYLVNFLPFGAGQFQQGRTGPGALLRRLRGRAGRGLDRLAYFAIQTLYKTFTYTYDDRLYPVSFTVSGIRPDQAGQYQAWNIVKLVSSALFYIAWAVGVGDALWHHQDEVVTTEKKSLDELEKTNPVAPKQTTGIQPFLFGAPGGGGGGIEVKFSRRRAMASLTVRTPDGKTRTVNLLKRITSIGRGPRQRRAGRRPVGPGDGAPRCSSTASTYQVGGEVQLPDQRQEDATSTCSTPTTW